MQRIVFDEKDQKFINRLQLLLVAAYVTATALVVLAASLSPVAHDVLLEPRVERQVSQVR